MQSLWRTSLLTGLAVLALSLTAQQALGQNKVKDNSKSVSFKSYDGVTLQGTLYPPSGKKKDAVVLLLHDFSSKKGGSRSQDKWPDLARALSADGFAVLTFDFRGFGDSRDVTESFWQVPHNGLNYIKRRGVKPPAAIDQKDFTSAYYPYLVNDVAAAKAYLDRRNDARELNSSNVILVGAGQGAAIGAMWLYNESIRRRDKNPNAGLGGVPMLGEPESKDIAGCVWLTVPPSVEGQRMSVAKWLANAAIEDKIPMGFYYGKKDTRGDRYINQLVPYIKGKSRKPKDVPVGAYGIDGTNLAGSKLLDATTIKSITTQLGKVMDLRGGRESIERKITDSAYYYMPTARSLPVLNKRPGEETPGVDMRFVR